MLATIVCAPADHSAMPLFERMIGALTGLAIAVKLPPETFRRASAPPRPAIEPEVGATGPRVIEPVRCPLATSPNGELIVIVSDEIGMFTGLSPSIGPVKSPDAFSNVKAKVAGQLRQAVKSSVRSPETCADSSLPTSFVGVNVIETGTVAPGLTSALSYATVRSAPILAVRLAVASYFRS